MKYFVFLLIFFLHCTLFSQNCIISSIQFEGNKKTNVSFLKSLIETKAGEVLNQKTLQQDVTRLIRLPSIANATHVITKYEEECVLVIKIEENTTLIPFINFFETIDRKLAYTFGLFEHDFLKRGMSFGGWYQKNIFDSYAVSLNAPFLFSKKLGLSSTFQSLSTQEPVFFEAGTALYKYTNRSVEVLGLYQFDFKNKISLGVNVFEEIYDDINIENIPEAPTKYSVDKMLFKFGYTFDNLFYNYQYVSGFKSEFNFQYVTASQQNDSNFTIVWNDFLFFKRLAGKGNFAQRLRIGFSKNTVSPFAPFAVDNNLNIRGVGYIIDRGTGVIVLNTEFRYTLIENSWGAIQSNVFIDAGTWRNPGGDLKDFTDNNNVRVFPGVGIRLIHKKIFNLIFRADYGYGLGEDEPSGLVFGIGQYF